MTACADLVALLEEAAADQAALRLATAEAVAPLLRIVGAVPLWVSLGGEDVPSLGLLVGRINNLGGGLATWRHHEQTGGTTVVNLPQSCDATLSRSWLNGVALGPGDIAISGSTATLAVGLEVGDDLLVRTYG